MAAPSKVVVPRPVKQNYFCHTKTKILTKNLPSSSTKTMERPVACLRIAEVSLISTKNVLSPAKMWSWAPILVKILSTGVNLHSSAGTGQPCRNKYFYLIDQNEVYRLTICAMITMRPNCLISVDLPPMLGPVSKSSSFPSTPAMVSFGMKSVKCVVGSRPSLITTYG